MSNAVALSHIWLFAGLAPQQLEKLTAFTFSKDFQPGDVIVEEGRTANGLYIIATGSVEIVKSVNTERQRRLATLGQGEFFGEMGLLEEQPRSATARALEPTSCVGIDRWLFLGQLRRDPDLAIAMLQAMARRLAETNALLDR